jgi:hypothetical protein
VRLVRVLNSQTRTTGYVNGEQALNQGASPNFKEEVPEAVLSTPRKTDTPKSPGPVLLARLPLLRRPHCAAPRGGAGAGERCSKRSAGVVQKPPVARV